VAKEERLKLTTGSRYRMTSMMTREEPLVTEGTFKGYIMVGNIDALIMDISPPVKDGAKAKGTTGKAKAKAKEGAKEGTEEGTKEELRLIPAQMIIAIDILDQAEDKVEEEKSPSSRYYY
jgi:hypothetical protein